MLALIAVTAMAAPDYSWSFDTLDQPGVRTAGSVRIGKGRSGKGLVLPGGGGVRIDAPDVFGGDFTAEVWVNLDSAPERPSSILSLGEEGAGWSLNAQENGAWAWQARDGKYVFDYEPTTKQEITGDWHRLTYVLRKSPHEARVYLDGKQKAVYSLAGLGTQAGAGQLIVGKGVTGGIDEVKVWTRALSDEEVGQKAPPKLPRNISIMAFNIWRSGKEDGEGSFERLFDVLRDADADVICMQETYGSGAEIADEFGYYFYLRSTNLSVMSKYPIGETFDRFRPFNYGLAHLEVGGGKKIAAGVTWLHYLPNTGEDIKNPDKTGKEIAEGEIVSRHTEMNTILSEIKATLANTEEIPYVMAGDFNSGSHLDFIEATKDRHNGKVVPWPVSIEAAKVGLIDTYRTLYPDPVTHPGITWSPKFLTSFQYRIDYVYSKGSALRPTASRVINSHAVQFPSDHAAVLTDFELDFSR
jgi:endonuclease/exonuclease/phosphatase family metal-dependent hydrolase